MITRSIAFCLAMLGLGVLLLLVNGRERAEDAKAPERTPSLRGAFALVRIPRYRALLIAGGALSLATASDAFVFLALQEKLDLGTSLFPLLFVGSAGTYMALAVPMGRLADRVGRGRVLLAGYGLLLGVYLVLLAPMAGWLTLAAVLGLLGSYYAATDGVLMALGSAIVPDEVRGSGLALLGTMTSLARLIASGACGAVGVVWGLNAAFACFGVALVAAAALTAVAFVRSPETA